LHYCCESVTFLLPEWFTLAVAHGGTEAVHVHVMPSASLPVI
jgi:hypothetical protein